MSENLTIYKSADIPLLVMLVGLPGSGKSTYANTAKIVQTNNEATKPVVHSSDALRQELYGDASVQGDNEQLFRELHARIKRDLAAGKDVVYDATNLKKKNRRRFLSELQSISCQKECIVFMTTFEACLHNNRQRDRQVPFHVIERMQKSFAPPHFNEGFSRIHFIFSYLGKDGQITHEAPEHGFEFGDFVERTKDFQQENSHHALTLGQHSYKTYEYIKERRPFDYALQLAALFHDNGKLYTKTRLNAKGMDDGNCHYYGHQNVGAYNVMFYADCIGFLPDVVTISNIIYYHMAPLLEWKQSERVRKFDKTLLGDELFEKIMLLHEADLAAH